MSIQKSLYSGLLYRILVKFKLVKLYDNLILFPYQFVLRKINSLIFSKNNETKVFFEYYNHYTHPNIRKRYYSKRAPLIWNNLRSSEVVHCIQFPKSSYLGKKVIIEPDDHCLVIGVCLGIYKPMELVSRCQEINDFIVSSNVSRVLLGNNELVNHAKYYFSRNALKKFSFYPEISCVPKVNKIFIKEKYKYLSSNYKVKYLSIASSFRYKAVDILIKSFMQSQCSGELTLVCHDVPDDFKRKIFKQKNIILIEDLPLKVEKKKQLYLNADVYVNTTNIDGGPVAVNALEYGLPIITNTYHRGKSFINNNNGILLSEPMRYYDPSGFGIKWNSIEGYLEQVDLLKKKGGYDDIVKQFINAFKFYEDNLNNILQHRLNSIDLAHNNSLIKSNQILRELYKKVALEEN